MKIAAFALVEARIALRTKERERTQLSEVLLTERSQAARSHEKRPLVETLSRTLDEIRVDSVRVAGRRGTIEERLSQVAAVLPLGAEQLSRMFELQLRFGLRDEDALILATSLLDLETAGSPSCFVTRDNKDFGKSELIRLVEGVGCKPLFNFDTAWQYIQSQL